MKITSIRKLDPEFTVDIEVAGTHTYQLENGTVSHNTSSLVLGTSSGIHDWHDDYYIRTMRVGKEETLYTFLKENHPEILEDDFFKPTIGAIISIPQKAPEGASTRSNTTAIELLERVNKVSKEWIKPGHRKGANRNNVSATITIKPEEWDEVGNWMWENKNNYTALSVLPYADHTYVQAPFQSITQEEYEIKVKEIHDINLDNIVEDKDSTSLKEEVACGGNGCEL